MENFKCRVSLSQEEVMELLGVPDNSSIISVSIDPDTSRIGFTLSTPEKAEGFYSISEFGNIPKTFARLSELVSNFVARKLGVLS